MGIRKAKIPGSRQSISFCLRGTLLWGTSCDFKLSQSHAHLSLALLSVFRETLSVPTFHYIYNNLLRYYEMIMVEKKEAIVWGRRSVDGWIGDAAWGCRRGPVWLCYVSFSKAVYLKCNIRCQNG